MRIRPSTPGDYPSVVAIHNTLYPPRPTTVQAQLEADQHRKPEHRHQVWVALLDEADRQPTVAGYGGYDQYPGYHAQKFHVFVNVLPDYQRQGFGVALYDQVMAGLQPFTPTTWRADCFGNLPQGIRFAEERGFKEVFRETPLLLDVTAFDPAPYAGLEARLRAQGIEIKTVRDLENDLHRNRKVYDLYWETFRDVPQEGETVPAPFDEWLDWDIEDPGMSPDGYFIAVCGQDYIALSEFARKPDTGILQAGLAGVRRAFRNKRIALALQVRAIAYARQIGCSCIETSTPITNVPMRALYAQLGFIRQPGWLQMEKTALN